MSILRATFVAAAVVIVAAAAATPFVRGTGVVTRVRNVVGLGDETGRLRDVERRFPGWRVIGFHHPMVTPGAGGTIIAGGQQPAGAIFRSELDRGAVYRLVIDGVPRDGSSSIRLRFDGDHAAWRTLERGRVVLVLPQTRTLEALVYSDAPYAYELRALSVERCVDCVTDQEFANAFPGWTVVPYVSAPVPVPYPSSLQVAWPLVLWPRTPAVELRGRGGPTGLLLTRALDRSVVYRLRVFGQRRNAAPTLRLRLDDQPFVWHTVDRGDGDLNIVLPKASRIEALLYSDAPYAFDVARLDVEPCGNCITDDEFVAKIRREAGVTDADAPLALARKLRDWVAKTVVFGEEPRNVAVTTAALMTQPAWQSYVDFFVPHTGGVWCAGIARYYQQVLALFNVPSLTLDIGYEGTDLTHVTDVIDARDGPTRRFYVFDPTFAAEYLDAADRDVDLASLVAGRPARFHMAALSRTMLIPTAALPTFLADAAAAHSQATCGASRVALVSECQVDGHNRFNLAVMRHLMAQQRKGDGDVLLTLLRHRVVAIHGSRLDPDAAADLRADLVRRGIPVSAIN